MVAIWAADVVGYSALMERDEPGTLARLFALRAQVLEPLIAEHGGRVFKTTGDGVLAEFGSALRAVEAGVAVQSALALRPDRDGTSLKLRVGVHAGEVVVVDGDLFGDDVNLAARLEGAADPGGIMISVAAHQRLKGALAEQFSEAGELDLKNISRPVRGFRWGSPAVSPMQKAAAGVPVLVAVLPFEDLSADPEHAFFAEGIVEDLITALSRSSWFDVITRSSSQAAVRESADTVGAGRRLGARFVVEGSVRFSGDRVRVNARLVDVESGRPTWSERLDRVVEDLFDLQDELVQSLAGAIEPEYVAAWRNMGPPRPTLTSWELAMRAWSAIYRGVQAGPVMDEAHAHFERAAIADPGNPLALGGLAFTLVNPWYQTGAERDIARAIEVAQQAIAIDVRDALPWFVLGYAHLVQGELRSGEQHLLRALALNPSLAIAASSLAVLYAFDGDSSSTEAVADRALALGPFDPLSAPIAAVARALACFTDADYDGAIRWADRSVGGARHNPSALRVLAASLELAGDHDRAIATVHDLLALGPVTIRWCKENLYPFGGPETQERYLAALSAAGIPE
jgi:class 3 adenylate cyclase/tetratricopeptide (TPR) repeat protein